MIVSVSRRTDVPAFFAPWFFNRVGQGFALVRNPMNYHQVSRVSLQPEDVDCLVFWTRNPRPLMRDLHRLGHRRFYFQYTVTAYGSAVEKNVPSPEDAVSSFQELSRMIGRERMIWRYDPVLINGRDLTVAWHEEHFTSLAEKLAGFARKCVISFYDDYRSVRANVRDLGLQPMDTACMLELGEKLSGIAGRFGLQIETCAEAVDLSRFNIAHGSCIDGRIVAEFASSGSHAFKDKNQREFCGCVRSVDIGSYNTCRHGCLYCYATHRHAMAGGSGLLHNPDSPFLIGEAEKDEKIILRRK